MRKKIQNIIKNLWLSEDCAKSLCGDCPKEKVSEQTTHECMCRCHTRTNYQITYSDTIY